eukprot:12418233-Karenia_brevis.AAC.1
MGVDALQIYIGTHVAASVTVKNTYGGPHSGECDDRNLGVPDARKGRTSPDTEFDYFEVPPGDLPVPRLNDEPSAPASAE